MTHTEERRAETATAAGYRPRRHTNAVLGGLALVIAGWLGMTAPVASPVTPQPPAVALGQAPAEQASAPAPGPLTTNMPATVDGSAPTRAASPTALGRVGTSVVLMPAGAALAGPLVAET